MNNFLNYLAERKYGLYHSLFIAIPQAYTAEDCFDRIVRDSRYKELLDLINRLPSDERRFVEERFNEIKESFTV